MPCARCSRPVEQPVPSTLVSSKSPPCCRWCASVYWIGCIRASRSYACAFPNRSSTLVHPALALGHLRESLPKRVHSWEHNFKLECIKYGALHLDDLLARVSFVRDVHEISHLSCNPHQLAWVISWRSLSHESDDGGMEQGTERKGRFHRDEPLVERSPQTSMLSASL